MSFHDDELFQYQALAGPIGTQGPVDGWDRAYVEVPVVDENPDATYYLVNGFAFVDFGITAGAQPTWVAALAPDNEAALLELEPLTITDGFDYVFQPTMVLGNAPLVFAEMPVVDEEPRVLPAIEPVLGFGVRFDATVVPLFMPTVPDFLPEHVTQAEYNVDWLYPEIAPAPQVPLDPANEALPVYTTPVFDEEAYRVACGELAAYQMPYFFFQIGRVFLVSNLDVWNIAFAELGLPPANSLADTKHHVVRTAAIWPTFRAAFIEDHPWNGAKKTIALNRRTEKPVARWQYQFDMPTDYIQALTVNGNKLQAGNAQWEIETDADGENKVLMTDEATVFLEYIFDPVEVGILSPIVQEAMGLMLASRLAALVGKKASERNSLERRAQDKLRTARSNDSREGIPRFFSNNFLAEEHDPWDKFNTT